MPSGVADLLLLQKKTLSRTVGAASSPLHTTLTITRVIVNCRIFDIAIHLIMAIMTIIDRIVIIIHSAPDRRHWPEASTIENLRGPLGASGEPPGASGGLQGLPKTPEDP